MIHRLLRCQLLFFLALPRGGCGYFQPRTQHFAYPGQHVHGHGEPATLYLADGCPLEAAFARQVFLGHAERLAQFGDARAYPFPFVHHIHIARHADSAASSRIN